MSGSDPRRVVIVDDDVVLTEALGQLWRRGEVLIEPATIVRLMTAIRARRREAQGQRLLR